MDLTLFPGTVSLPMHADGSGLSRFKIKKAKELGHCAFFLPVEMVVSSIQATFV